MVTMGSETKENEVEQLEIKALLTEFQDMFKERIELPPIRGAEHQIKLKEGVVPFKMQPYRYPYMQRKEIEKMVEEMLQAGTIQKERWILEILCGLEKVEKAITIKDSYPIPLIDDLLDELGKARIF